jgi:hypothetical protein
MPKLHGVVRQSDQLKARKALQTPTSEAPRLRTGSHTYLADEAVLIPAFKNQPLEDNNVQEKRRPFDRAPG